MEGENTSSDKAEKIEYVRQVWGSVADGETEPEWITKVGI